MPERQKGRDPNQYRSKLLPAYHQAARYPDEHASEGPYDQAQQAIYETPCDLSAYRLMLSRERIWHVAVLGDAPPEQLHRRITEILSTGEPVSLSDDNLIALNERRKRQTKHGEWVEGHYKTRRRTRR
jgi:hypothetical protein